MFERNFYEPATVALCKLELCVQFKIGILIDIIFCAVVLVCCVQEWLIVSQVFLVWG